MELGSTEVRFIASLGVNRYHVMELNLKDSLDAMYGLS